MRGSRSQRDTSFANFMDQAVPSLSRIAWFLTYDADHAQALTQAAFTKTYLAWPKIDHDRALPYARRCLVDHKLDVGRAAGHEMADVPDAGPELSSGSVGSGSQFQDDTTAETDPRDDLVRRLSLLPEQQRKVVVLRYYADQSEVAVADALGISLDTVKSSASLGLAALREHAQAQPQPPVHAPEPRLVERADPAVSIDLEGDLRREFNAAIPPSGTSNPESVMSEGSRTIRRRRLIGGGSAALVLALVAAGTGLLTRTDTAQPQPPPQPATPTATSTATPTATSAIVRADAGHFSTGRFQLEFNRDAKVRSNVKLFVVPDTGPRRQVAAWSSSKAGQAPDATWKSGMADGSPFTVGLVPGVGASITLADGTSYGTTYEELRGTGYTMFAVQYQNGDEKGPSRPARIASISWSGPTGIIDGIEGSQRLSGRVLTIATSASVRVVLRPGEGRRTTVRARVDKDGQGFEVTPATTDRAGVAIVTGRLPVERRTKLGREVSADGPPVAAGILPPGASDLGMILTTGEDASGLPVLERLPDGRMIFAVMAEGDRLSSPSKDWIKTVTWANADGSRGRKSMPPEQR